MQANEPGPVDSRQPSARPGDILELSIDRLAFGGDGVARHGGIVVFVPRALPGERVRARCVAAKKNMLRARLLEVTAPAPDRARAACPLYDRCPGCCYQHAGYAVELAAKQEHLCGLLARIGRCRPDRLRPPFAAPSRFGYRNKIVLHCARTGAETALGYYAEDNRTVFDVPACPLACSPINETLAALRADGGFRDGLRAGCSVTFRHTPADGVVFWDSDRGPPRKTLVEPAFPTDLAVPADSFFQVNPDVGRELTRFVAELAAETAPDRLCDAYCGAGVFALAALKAGVKQAVGIESDGAAVAAARENAGRLGLGDRARFTAATVESALARALDAHASEKQLLVLDPPRTGLATDVISAIVASRVAAAIYVSCAADTLARDAARLAAGGFRLAAAGLFDMFPATPHFETVAQFVR